MIKFIPVLFILILGSCWQEKKDNINQQSKEEEYFLYGNWKSHIYDNQLRILLNFKKDKSGSLSINYYSKDTISNESIFPLHWDFDCNGSWPCNDLEVIVYDQGKNINSNPISDAIRDAAWRKINSLDAYTLKENYQLEINNVSGQLGISNVLFEKM
jgi:hypothetical protein